MKIVFFSNFLNHHQLPLCQAFLKHEDIDFTFAATEQIPQDRLDMKYEDMNTKYPFVLRTYENDACKEKAMQLAREADIVMIGSAPNEYIEARLKQDNKFTYRFCERSLRKGTWRRFIPRTHKRIVNDYLQYRNNNLYILGASAYTAHDLALCGFPNEKCFAWGYFPAVYTVEDIEATLSMKEKNSIIWVGRFIECKHPEAALKIAKSLKKNGAVFKLRMIGDGPLKTESERFVHENGLDEYVEFCGSMPTDEVRSWMLKSEVFLFNSDFYEGWGAVVNEAMNSMCVPIVSHACGSAAFLIHHGLNGFIYQYGRLDEAERHIIQTFGNENLRKTIARNAYQTMIATWNAENAVIRLLELTNHLQIGDKTPYTQGPCSLSPILTNMWHRGEA